MVAPLFAAGARRRVGFALLVLAVAAAHWGALALWRADDRGAESARGTRALQVRQIVAAPAVRRDAAVAVRSLPAPSPDGPANRPEVAPPTPARGPNAGGTASRRPKPEARATAAAAREMQPGSIARARGRVAAQTQSRTARPAAPGLASPTAPRTSGAQTAPATLRTDADAGSSLATLEAGSAEPPRYATRVPPAARLVYAFRRGPGAGVGELVWRLDGDRYELALRGGAGRSEGPGVDEVLGWTSRGSVDASGVAPERFVARRHGRDLLAVNFQRQHAEGARITFSGPSVQLPLPPGVQDRVSWMLQLAAILEADPALGTEGRSVAMWAVGPRGDAQVWSFVVQDRGAIEWPGQRVAEAVHLLREPLRPYDLRVEVWLDPAHHHLPVRVRLQAPPGGPASEFLLRSLHYE